MVLAQALGYLAKGCPVVATYPEAAGATYKAGEIVVISGGKVARAANTGGVYNSGQVLVGRALADATGVTDAPANILVASRDIYFALPKTNNGGNAVATAVTDIGNNYGLFINTISNVNSCFIRSTEAIYGVAVDFERLPDIQVPGESAGRLFLALTNTLW